MKRARMLVLAIAVVAGGLTMMLVRGLVQQPQQQRVEVRTVDTVDVLVAKIEIRLGDSVKAGDLHWMPWPRQAAAQGYITKSARPRATEDFAGAVARAPFLAGEPIKEQKLIRASEGGVMAAILPVGMRAISTPIREETAAGGFILPNDRVDVLITRKMRGGRGGEEHVADTLFRDVRILAIGQLIETKDGKKVAEGKTATLELTPVQAEQLALARSMGDISLALRSLQEKGDGSPVTNNESLNNKRERGNSISVLRYGVRSRAFGVN